MENKVQSNNENIVNEHNTTQESIEATNDRKNAMTNMAKILNMNHIVIMKTLHLLLKACNDSKVYDKLVNKNTESHVEIEFDDIKKEFDDFTLSKISNDMNISIDELFKTIKSLIDPLINNTSLGAINDIVVFVSSIRRVLENRLYKDEEDKNMLAKVKEAFKTFTTIYNKKERIDYNSFK